MNRYLFLLRHAEAEQDAPGGDINRALTPRGTESVVLMGENLRARGERVQKICSSTALRAGQTARSVCPYLGYDADDIDWRPELYLASPGDLHAFLSAVPPRRESLLLVGHNPGLQGLLRFLAAPASLPPDSSMSTAAVAKLEVAGDWSSLQPGCARLVYLIKPE
jgi:phosphohistidine phosphatase